MLTKSKAKYIQSLNEKKLRNQDGVFVAEGPKIINELLSNDQTELLELYATGDWMKQHPELTNRLSTVDLIELKPGDIDRISFLTTPHQVLGIFRQPVFTGTIAFEGKIVLLLDGIQDPGNFGTILRIADWFGISHVVAGRDCVDLFNPKVVQSTMGSIARVKVAYEDLEAFMKQHAGFAVYAASLNGTALSAYGKIKEGMLLIGNESRGVREELLQLAQHRVTIPRIGSAESLNAAVATGIILSHIL